WRRLHTPRRLRPRRPLRRDHRRCAAQADRSAARAARGAARALPEGRGRGRRGRRRARAQVVLRAQEEDEGVVRRLAAAAAACLRLAAGTPVYSKADSAALAGKAVTAAAGEVVEKADKLVKLDVAERSTERGMTRELAHLLVYADAN